jgi:hypothetical protein
MSGSSPLTRDPATRREWEMAIRLPRERACNETSMYMVSHLAFGWQDKDGLKRLHDSRA